MRSRLGKFFVGLICLLFVVGLISILIIKPVEAVLVYSESLSLPSDNVWTNRGSDLDYFSVRFDWSITDWASGAVLATTMVDNDSYGADCYFGLFVDPDEGEVWAGYNNDFYSFPNYPTQGVVWSGLVNLTGSAVAVVDVRASPIMSLYVLDGSSYAYAGWCSLPVEYLTNWDGYDGGVIWEDSLNFNGTVSQYVYSGQFDGAVDYWTVTFDSSCWTNGDVYYGVNILGEDYNSGMKVSVNSSVFTLLVSDGAELWIHGVADSGYYFGGSEVDFVYEADDSSTYSGYKYTIVDDCTVSVTFSEWTEEFDNECFVAFTVDNDYTKLNVLINGEVYNLGNGGSLFYNFSVPYNTVVTFGYWNTYYTFESWHITNYYIDTGVADSLVVTSENGYGYALGDNPFSLFTWYTDDDNRDTEFDIYPVAVYNNVATPSPVPSASATADPSDVVTPFFTVAVPVLVPLALFLIPAMLSVVAVAKATSGNVNPVLPFFGGGTAGMVLGYVAWSSMVPLYAVVSILLIDVAVVYGVTRGNGGGG